MPINTLGSARVNENEILGVSRMTQECATPVESAIVLWYWVDADINTSTGDEDDPWEPRCSKKIQSYQIDKAPEKSNHHPRLFMN